MHYLSSCLLGILFLWQIAAVTLPQQYDEIWTSQSQTNGSAASMPLGGGDIGLNVWAENGTILFYIAKSGTFDENNSLLKLGRARLTLNPNPFALDSTHFEQRLLLQDGFIQLTGSNSTIVRLWVDVFDPVIHVDVSSAIQVDVLFGLESWRYEDHLMSVGEQDQSSWQGIPNLNISTYKDSVSFNHNGIIASHRNRNYTVFDATVEQQELGHYKQDLYNPLGNSTFGLRVSAKGLVPANVTSGYYADRAYRSWNLKSQEPAKISNISITLHQNQTSSLDEWQSQLDTVANLSSTDQTATLEWWHAFWNRSHIFINTDLDPSEPSFQVGKNYQLFRYMLGCNAYGEWPTRFNGGLFTFDPAFVDSQYNYSADFRLWSGGTFTAQNQRLVYWPMLKSGDIDMMKPQFDFYKRITQTNQVRGREYYGLNQTFFTEQIENFGLPQIFQYNVNTYIFNTIRPEYYPRGLQFNEWLSWLQDTALEFCQMILDASLFTDYDVSPYLQFIENELMWFDTFYQHQAERRDVGNIPDEALDPALSMTSYKGTYNAASTVSGLRAVLTRLLQVNPDYQIGNKSYYMDFLRRVPQTPLRQQQGHTTIAPAEAYNRIQNVEIPQLYPVFPWAEYGLGLPNLSHAVNTYLYDIETQAFHGYEGWRQDAIWLARMGMTDMAMNVTVLKMEDSKVNRFPTFWGPNFDWTPDINNGGSGMIGLQEMLLQTYNNGSHGLRLIPAWPSNWTVDFKLHAPFNTTVEGRVQSGKFQELVVTPNERMADVIIGNTTQS